MTPDIAARAIPNGRSDFESNAKPRRSQTLSKYWGDRHQSLSACLGFDRAITHTRLR